MISKFKLSLKTDKPGDVPISQVEGQYESDEWLGENLGELIALARRLKLKPNMCVFTLEFYEEEWPTK